ncbi:hypothetical protein L0U95_24125 (plasmid) [Burkholderia cenocepacia]|uniref:hypothetical protein n=1 Tax=Burkholderia cenocepacia TaxID=95486 RepID=UPI001F21B7E0|nr:hypothetical protein [Burkholderia cenocepacia]UJH75028.1 hypothetical protein L0U95_24125 [Burkholderia cenocepacia]
MTTTVKVDILASEPDWKEMLSDLIAGGMSQTAIATHIGVTQGAISQLLSGAQKSLVYAKGKRLVELHNGRCASAEPTKAPA